jgi:hypothetical protein
VNEGGGGRGQERERGKEETERGKGRKEGRERGREEGRERGREEGRADLEASQVVEGDPCGAKAPYHLQSLLSLFADRTGLDERGVNHVVEGEAVAFKEGGDLGGREGGRGEGGGGA